MDFLEHEIEEILNIFREESEEQLQKLNKNLLTLESNPKDYTAISELFREAHSLKGAARMIGLDDIQSIAHKLEDVFGLAKEGDLEVCPEIVDIMCKAVDCITSIVSESIRTRGKAEVPEIQEVLTSLQNVIDGNLPAGRSLEGSDIQEGAVIKYPGIYKNPATSPAGINPQKERQKVSDNESQHILNRPEVKGLLTQINVNIEKLKVFSTSTDALEEFLYFVNKLAESIEKVENQRLKGLLDDIRIKVETALKGSGILVLDEVQEIEETFENFINLTERACFAGEKEKNKVTGTNIEIKKEEEKVFTPAPVIKKEEVSPAETLQEWEKEQTDKPAKEPLKEPVPAEIFTEDFILPRISPGETKETHPEPGPAKTVQDNSNEIDYIRSNISIFSNHTEENSSKFEDIITRLNGLTANINEDNARQIIEKITELLSFSKEKEAPINPEMVNVLEESFDDAVKMMSPSDEEASEDPSLIIRRIGVLHQMLKLAVSQEATKKKEKNDLNPQPAPSDQKKVNYSPVKRSAGMYKKNVNEKEDKTGPLDIKFGDSNTIKTLRVDTQKLDQLVNQAGELIIAKIKAKEHLSDIEKIIRYIEEWHREWTKTKQYFRYANKYHYKPTDSGFKSKQLSSGKNINTFFEENSSKLISLMNKINSLHKVVQEDDARLNLIVGGLEEKIKSVRVLPLATIFHLFPRMVRDIARDRNKEIEFFITGSDTSVDKKIIEEIKSPLMHIIRNSIDHGVEIPSERVAKGKNPTGKVLLAAYHLENSVLIEVSDDGKGVDIETIKKKVLQKELLTKEELDAMSEEQIMNIIFWPGFSTGETVTDISGRGIGLDIVHTKINQLNGSIKVKSTLGQGCQVSIQIPVTMATINSFLVETNGQTFAIPTNSIKTTLLVDEKQVFYKEGERTILVEDRTVPICALSKVLELPDNPNKPDKNVIIVVQAEDAQVGFIVDKLIGDHEILHKNLSAPLLRVRNVAGITTLGSGDLCLILNVHDLVKSAYMRFGKTSVKQLSVTITPELKETRKKTALVVDDSTTTRILQKNILKSSGYDVEVAVNGFDALTKVASSQFDFIVTDVEMPEIDGFELTERLRQDERYKHIPIIMVTSLASEENRVKGLNAGASAYLTKGSFDQDELLRTIRQLID